MWGPEQTLRPASLGLNMWLYHLLAVWLWATCITSLCLGFPVCKMGMYQHHLKVVMSSMNYVGKMFRILDVLATIRVLCMRHCDRHHICVIAVNSPINPGKQTFSP